MTLPSGVTGPVEWMELSAAMRFPASVTGPRDLAPFAREAAIRNFELTAELWQTILGTAECCFGKLLKLLIILLKKRCERLPANRLNAGVGFFFSADSDT